jgi:plasmid maintenance system antidote protein VapI
VNKVSIIIVFLLFGNTKKFMSDLHLNKLKLELLKAGKSQKWLAQEMGWTEKHVSLIANNKAGTTVDNWQKIAGLLTVSVGALIDIE